MRLTFALGLSHGDMMNQIAPKNILVSYEYKAALTPVKWKPEYLIFDSGAFSAWSADKKVDVVGYADWATEQAKNFPRVVCVNMDVIPGKFGRTSTLAERKAGMALSLKNADYLRSRGLNVMEVFHQDEPRDFLDLLLSRQTEKGVLGISPRNDVAVNSKIAWQKTLMSYLHQTRGKNFPRTHGLAVTSYDMLCNFPYYSADSSTWSSPFRFGGYTDEMGKTKKIAAKFGVEKITYAQSRESVRHLARQGIENQQRMGDSITSLWEKRGIVWED
jgi:hypothetical protein